MISKKEEDELRYDKLRFTKRENLVSAAAKHVKALVVKGRDAEYGLWARDSEGAEV